ncbi:hypothetical protein [Luteibacter sp. CQ10]|uniref:hypothetical protein n=1 Tax=Luteibacter sp. CQ10 TaxID=2805821 RepID=UPI0034A1AC9D
MNGSFGAKIFLCFVLLCPGLTWAASQALWGYPCDVFMSAACLRLPNDMSISYEVPADFGIYTVSRSGEAFLSIYVGSAPRLPDLARASLKLDAKGYKIRGFHSTVQDKERLDVIVLPTEKGGDVVHLFARLSEDKRDAIAMVVAGLRLCSRPTPELVRCPLLSEPGKEIADWVRAQRLSGAPSP